MVINMDFKETIMIKPADFKRKVFKKFVLTADVGGTNTDFAVFGVDAKKTVVLIFKLHFISQALQAFKDAIDMTLEYSKKDYKIEITDACFGVAGPLFEDRQLGDMTNIEWDIDTRILKKETALKNIILLNDLEAIGFGIEVLPEEDIEELAHTDDSTPEPQPKETKVVIAAGTGLGESIIPYNHCKKNHIPIPSEGGNSDMVARTDFQREMVKYLIEHKLCHMSFYPDWEEVLSGRGIENMFRFLVDTKKVKTDKKVKDKINDSDDKAATIAEFAKQGDKACGRTMDLFFELLGQAASSLALTTKSIGGLYIAGGIATEDIGLLKKSNFMEAFDATRAPNHPLHSVIMKTPIFIIKNDDIGLYGAANAAAHYQDMF
ncbi:glucokinase [Thermoproteota archaeon]